MGDNSQDNYVNNQQLTREKNDASQHVILQIMRSLQCSYSGFCDRGQSPNRTELEGISVTRGLLVIVGTEVVSCTKFTGLRRRGQSTGRVSVVVDVDPAVDLPTRAVDAVADTHGDSIHEYTLRSAKPNTRSSTNPVGLEKF
jgi:hypothetical protein